MLVIVVHMRYLSTSSTLGIGHFSLCLLANSRDAIRLILAEPLVYTFHSTTYSIVIKAVPFHHSIPSELVLQRKAVYVGFFDDSLLCNNLRRLTIPLVKKSQASTRARGVTEYLEDDTRPRIFSHLASSGSGWDTKDGVILIERNSSLVLSKLSFQISM